jgi:hypothetical protein
MKLRMSQRASAAEHSSREWQFKYQQVHIPKASLSSFCATLRFRDEVAGRLKLAQDTLYDFTGAGGKDLHIPHL